MLLGGLQKISLIDYPGKVSCVLFLSGCNFNCPYCHNPDLARGRFLRPPLLDENAFYDFLQRRKGFLDGVVISGGEPTLQKDLTSFCTKIKQIGYPLKLDTNGSRPLTIRQLLDEGLIDYIAMDIKTDPFCYSPLITKKYDPKDIVLSIQTIMESTVAYEFRTTCVKPIVASHDIERIAKNIKGATLYTLQRFHNTKVLHPEFFKGLEAGYKEDELYDLKSMAESWVKKCTIR